VPVKTLAEAKSRLEPALSPAMRRQLVLTMLEDVLEALRVVPAIDHILVVTADSDVGAFVRGRSAIVLPEEGSRGLNAALSLGVAHALRKGASRVLLIPADLPFASPDEIAEVMTRPRGSDSHGAVIVPDRAGKGTNALLLAPLDALEPNFGPGSFMRHCEQARARNIFLRVSRLAGLSFDVDDPADLALMTERHRGQPRYAFLRDTKRAERAEKMGAGEP
jgi:2-phospho-L-lactate guanylyltransferase